MYIGKISKSSHRGYLVCTCFNYGSILGPKLPFELYAPVMVTSHNKNGVVIIGGNLLGSGATNNLFELENVQARKWKPMRQTLKYARYHHVALHIHDELTDCSK